MTPNSKHEYLELAYNLASQTFHAYKLGDHRWQELMKEVSRIYRFLEETPPLELLDLPQDMMIAIISELDVPDVLKIRQTCKALERASRERPIWLNLFQKTLPLGFKLDYPIEMYTRQELERYTIRFISSNMICRDEDPPVIDKDHIHRSSWNQIGHFYLSESGRWLLVLMENGGVDYYDLDNSVQALSPGRPLIPSSLLLNHQESCMVADVDYTAPNLTFNLALYTRSDDDLRVSFFQVWKVKLTQHRPVY